MSLLAKSIIYEAIKERTPGSDFDKFLANLQEWEFCEIHRRGDLLGAYMHLNGHVHIAILEQFRSKWATRALIEKILKDVAMNGKVYTTVLADDSFRNNFAERLGFRLIQSGQINIYEAQLNA